MVNEIYSIAIPLDHSQCLEVTFRVMDKQPKTGEDSTRLNTLTPVDADQRSEIETSHRNKLPEYIIRAIKTAHKAFAGYLPRPQSFMTTTATGFQLLHMDQIVYFDYQADKKQWVIMLADQTQLPLKRNTIAENILSYSPHFIQINQRQIINLDYLDRIDGRSCQLSIHPGNDYKLIISRSYLKGLQEKIEVI